MVLRNDLDLSGPRFGCGLGQFGACTVLISGEAVRSCIRPISQVAGAEITTLEGLAQDGKLHPLQQAWIDEQVPQCGFCQNGQILTAKALLDKTPNPTDAQIREGMNGTLCRCMTYWRSGDDARRQRRHHLGERWQHHGARLDQLRRSDWRQEVQRHADRQEHRHHDRHREAQAGPRDEERRQVAAAVVCEREENAIRAARQLKCEWKQPATAPFPTSDNLFTYMRSATPSFTGSLLRPATLTPRSRARRQ